MRAYQQALAMALMLDEGIPGGMHYIGSNEYPSSAFVASLVDKDYLSSLPKDPLWSNGLDNASSSYVYRNQTTSNAWVLGDDDPNTYAIRFRLENPPATGSPYFCMTSVGIHQAGTRPGVANSHQCLQE